MKLLTLRTERGYRPGVMVGNEILDLELAAPALGQAALPPSLKAILALGQDGLARVRALAERAADATEASKLRTAGALIAGADAVLGPVIPDPELVLSGAMNSRGHLHEMNDAEPGNPIAFQKTRAALAGSGQAIAPPPAFPDMLDWEGEFCVVIGKTCHNITPDQALDHIVGFTLMNDISARDFVPDYVQSKTRMEMTEAWDRLIAGKNFPTFCPIGPVIVTRDEFDGVYRMETRVNGEVMQSSGPDDLVFGFAEFIAYFSQFYLFQPGDVISMGSPPGVGMARKPPLFLKPGDVVEVVEPRIGSLSNPIGVH